MNKRFDPKKLTLTDFKPSAFQTATTKLVLEQQQQKKDTSAVPTNDPVPEGRTTLRLNKLRGVVSPNQDQAATPVPPVAQPAEPVSVTPSIEQPEPPPVQPTPAQSSIPIPPSTQPSEEDEEFAPGPLPPPPDVSTAPSENILTSTQSTIDISAASPTIPSAERNERMAGLHVRAVRVSKPVSTTIDPDDTVPFNTRQPKWLKDAFFKACHDKSQTPSLVIRNLMKSFCGLCLVMAFVSITHARESQDSTYSTDNLLSYFVAKSFSIKTLLPDFKATASVRQSLWQQGAQDSTDYVYADRSNTRLEARVDIPILDLSYLRDRTKNKDELRAFVMKSLSKILAAQKSVNVLETRLSMLRTRLDYLRNQVTLKLANKSDLFPVEDEFYAAQSQMYEAQSTLEQRIIDLAVIAGNEWLEAYRMIVKWDGKLFEQM